jgi:hypothetical protein
MSQKSNQQTSNNKKEGLGFHGQTETKIKVKKLTR